MSDEGYDGAATLVVDGRELAVSVLLRGYFEPIDGRFHWYGRLAAHTELADLVGSARKQALLTTPDGAATGELGEPDLWGRYRITGTGTPPLRVPTTLDDLP